MLVTLVPTNVRRAGILAALLAALSLVLPAAGVWAVDGVTNDDADEGGEMDADADPDGGDAGADLDADAGADVDGDVDADSTEVAEEEFEPFFADTLGRGHDDAVLALAAEGVLQGCDDELYCPDRPVSRAQLATMVFNALEMEPLEEGPFADVEGNRHAGAINAIAAAGITVGCGEGLFCPGDTVSREQLASLFVRAFDIPATSTQHFDDLSRSHGANVNALAEVGIAAGCSEPLNYFCSQDEVLRWHSALFLARTLDLVERVELTPLAERRAEQERIDAEREAKRQAELEAEREAEVARQQAEEDAARAAERLAMWESLAQCESNGNWQLNSGNGYYGGLQFHIQTWRGVGGTGYPHQHSKTEQIYRAERLLQQSWATFSNQWPACSRKLGLG